MPDTSHFAIGSLPLCLKGESAEDCRYDEFDGLLNKVRDRLRSLPNVEVIECPADDEKSVRYPRLWSPIGEDDRLERGRWIFSEYFHPLIFKVHLPSRLQESIFPDSSFSQQQTPEDFLIAYDGMIFVVLAETPSKALPFGVPAAIRRYLMDLLKSIDEFTAAYIPPTPLHLELSLRSAAAGDKPSINYDPELITIIRSGPTLTPENLLKLMYFEVRAEVQSFYHLQIDVSTAEEQYYEILQTERDTYERYGELIDAPKWKLFRRMGLRREISRLISHGHHSICEYSVAVAEIENDRLKLIARLSNNELLSVSSRYFQDMTKTSPLDYSIFLNSLGHIRSHLLVIEQDRYVLYAAIVGAVITLTGTAVGLLLGQPKPH